MSGLTGRKVMSWGRPCPALKCDRWSHAAPLPGGTPASPGRGELGEAGSGPEGRVQALPVDTEGAALSCFCGDHICWEVEREARVELVSQGSVCVLEGQLPGRGAGCRPVVASAVWAGTPRGWFVQPSYLCGTKKGITSLGRGGHSTRDRKLLVP